jgi:hypothetical protein
MSKLGRLWDWLLPGLIFLSPEGAIAYYSADAQKEAAPLHDSARAGRSALVSNPPMGAAVLPLARL